MSDTSSRSSDSDSDSDSSQSNNEDDALSREFDSLGLQDDLPLPIVPLGERATMLDYRKVSNDYNIRHYMTYLISCSTAENYKFRIKNYVGVSKLKSSN